MSTYDDEDEKCVLSIKGTCEVQHYMFKYEIHARPFSIFHSYMYLFVCWFKLKKPDHLFDVCV